jgi:hypothetical protein
VAMERSALPQAERERLLREFATGLVAELT